MTTASSLSAALDSWPWVRRLRLLVAVALVWAGLHYLVEAAFLPRGLNRPVGLAAAGAPALTAPAIAVVLWLGAYVGTWVAGARHQGRGLMVVALALAAWAVGGGTMTDWLIYSARDGAVGPPTSRPYWPLVAEYLFLAVVMAGATVAASLAMPAAPGPPGSDRVRGVLGRDSPRSPRAAGVVALLITTGLIVILMLVLTGPVVGDTLRGQVYFAVAVACALAVFTATRLVKVGQPIWYWPAPILAGLIGVLVAAVKPDLLLPAGYNQLNSIPAWGLARPLPIEMVGVGVAVCLWTVRAAAREPPSERA